MGDEFLDLPGAPDYLARRQAMLARHDRERAELARRQSDESMRMTEEFRASLHGDQEAGSR